MSKNQESVQNRDWQIEFVRNWESVGRHWGVPKAMLTVHAWLIIQRTPRSTDDVMNALDLSRGTAHTMLQELTDWQLVYPLRSMGSRQVKFIAEQDPWTMMIAIMKKRKERELLPLLELNQWNASNKANMEATGHADLHRSMERTLHFAAQINQGVELAFQEDEAWWWRWLLNPLRTKLKSFDSSHQ
ncbi:MAG: hypothetical protein O2818_01170 [Bacteroidetes bacterium]|nr:hypothetical protein [Bacteroidota bacterium]